jgi:O-methyltransferase involved in polyketide biosynthesis
METTNSNSRNYDTISPSARALLLMKGLTNIPFARQAAELMMRPEKYVPDYSNTNFEYWARVAHFESRYLSIDQLLAGLPIKNILELSSGFSFRGLETVRQKDVHYIDTDLAGIIEKKKEFVAALQNDRFVPKGKLELLPLNALDEQQFIEAVNHFGEGEIVIVNEGLLMYLGTEEKQKLCSTIRKILKQRGGYWITADIYVRYKRSDSLKMNDELQQFFDQHRIEDNMFESMKAAEEFFKGQGFVIDKEAEPDYSKLSSINFFLKNTTQEQLAELSKVGRIQTTWRLKPSGD